MNHNHTKFMFELHIAFIYIENYGIYRSVSEQAIVAFIYIITNISSMSNYVAYIQFQFFLMFW